MDIGFRDIEALLPGYLTGDLSVEECAIIDKWRNESFENEKRYNEFLGSWEALQLLQEMEQYNSFEALKKVNEKLSKPRPNEWVLIMQRIAALFLLPVLIYAGYVTTRNFSLKKLQEEQVVMQTITSSQGMVSQFVLADGTKVWLNSGSQLQFPTQFIKEKREVKLIGEAFFEVAKNEKQPFRVNARDLNIDVLGTKFNVINYNDDSQTEVILVEGKVKLAVETGQSKKEYGTMHPGQRSVYKEDMQKIYAEEVDVDKYIAWRDGNLIFRNDNMEDVVKRLSRWFNVEIVINDTEIKSYVYKATFRDENLIQVLNLLKISAPIDYKITGRKVLPNGEYTKQKVYLMRKKI